MNDPMKMICLLIVCSLLLVTYATYCVDDPPELSDQVLTIYADVALSAYVTTNFKQAGVIPDSTGTLALDSVMIYRSDSILFFFGNMGISIAQRGAMSDENWQILLEEFRGYYEIMVKMK